MAREVEIWPAHKKPEALAYNALTDAAYAALTGDPDDTIFAYCRADRHGQWVTPYFGPTGFEWNGSGVEEPFECLAARADAELSNAVDWPSDE